MDEDNGAGRADSSCWERNYQLKFIKSEAPLGGLLLRRIGLFRFKPYLSYRVYILVLTFLCYTCYHMTRKPFSVVFNVLAPDCKRNINTSLISQEVSLETRSDVDPYDYTEGWPPFNTSHCKAVIGAVDYSWLFTYAVFLVLSGLIADRVNLRYFLTVGMIGSGFFVGLLGVAYFAQVHHISYFVIVQIFVGIFESTGWPGVVAVMGNWFGKRHRGLLLGVWNSHTSVGNILGTAVPSIWARTGKPWGWSFLVPAFVMIFMGMVIFFFLIVDPKHVGLPPPVHHLDPNELEESQPTATQSFEMEERVNEEEQDIDDSGKSDDEEALLTEDDTPQGTETNGLISNNQQKSDPSYLCNCVTQRRLLQNRGNAISLIGALKIPGVIEFSISLFFAKLVAYTFLFWLPYYVAFHPIGGRLIGEQNADLLATLYDVGGIVGGIFTGGLSDIINARAISCVIMMYCAVPTLFLYRYVSSTSLGATTVLIILTGLFTNGPYALITTAVSNDLGTHKSLKENQRAKATVGAIIDGTGSLGAACGPLITGIVSDYFGWDKAFYVLMAACFLSSLMLSRLVVKEFQSFYSQAKRFLKRLLQRQSYSLSL